MIVLLSKDKSLIKRIKSIENVKLVNNLFECQEFLNIPDMECDLLVLDYKLIDIYYEELFNWIIDKNLFIKAIIIYYTTSNYEDTKQMFYKEEQKLKDANYPTNIVSIDDLMKAMRNL